MVLIVSDGNFLDWWNTVFCHEQEMPNTQQEKNHENTVALRNGNSVGRYGCNVILVPRSVSSIVSEEFATRPVFSGVHHGLERQHRDDTGFF